MSTFVTLPNGQWAISMPMTLDSCDLESGAPITVERRDGSLVEVQCRKHHGHRLYGGAMSCIYLVQGTSRVIRPAPRPTSLPDLWDESR